jgi:hypothetical protein
VSLNSAWVRETERSPESPAPTPTGFAEIVGDDFPVFQIAVFFAAFFQSAFSERSDQSSERSN